MGTVCERVNAAALVLAATLALGACSPSAPEVVLPPDLANFDPELRTLIEGKARAVRAAPGDAGALGSLGLVYEAQRQWREARLTFEAASALDPSEPLWVHHAALCLHHNGLSQDALAYLSQHADRIGACAPAQHLLGVLLLQAGDAERAREAFVSATRLAPDRPEGFTGLGEALAYLERPDAALPPLDRAVALDPDYRAAHYLRGLTLRSLGREEEALAALARGAGSLARILPDRFEEERASYLVSRVDRLAAPQRRTKGSRHVAAQSNADAVLEHDPNDATALMIRVRALMQQGAFPEALESLERVLVAEPDHVDALVCRGTSLAQMGKPGPALADLVRATELAPSSVDAHSSLASLYLQTGRTQDALAAASRAVGLAPEVAEAHSTLAMAHLGVGQRAEARASFERALELKPKNRQILEACGRAWHQMGDREGSRAIFARLVEVAPRYGLGYAYLARAEHLLGESDAARDHFEEARRRGAGGPVMAYLVRALAGEDGPR